MTEKKIVIQLPHGLHARPAAQFVQKASSFASEINLQKGAKTVNAKSIMGVMSLAAANGEEVTLTADGSDEKEAIEALTALLISGE
ncbi:HPr family phosphocarrier protein [Brevibacillus fulvus]|uniref:Phosphocarrier protein HPr n=1 Tax=Brevibacillus fulvus TaxID=1125967 RepID=A0A938Y2N9_9BACL|nr:HPr family phosphocarrier protein [Brevibacillus fulvus]MBM7592048.1 catabolite repression HPr-like protein/phosphocarrier protein [Brevibacillus fulvus]